MCYSVLSDCVTVFFLIVLQCFFWLCYSVFLLYLSCDVRSFVIIIVCTLISFKDGNLFILACCISAAFVINISGFWFCHVLRIVYICWQQFTCRRCSASLRSYKPYADPQIISPAVLLEYEPQFWKCPMNNLLCISDLWNKNFLSCELKVGMENKKECTNPLRSYLLRISKFSAFRFVTWISTNVTEPLNQYPNISNHKPLPSIPCLGYTLDVWRINILFPTCAIFIPSPKPPDRLWTHPAFFPLAKTNFPSGIQRSGH
jgi:hypothetical protein